MIPELGRGQGPTGPAAVAMEILRSYLFVVGDRRWSRIRFDEVWDQCAAYYDSSVSSLEHQMHAPVVHFPSRIRSLKLDDTFTIRRFTPAEVARLATLDPGLGPLGSIQGRPLWTQVHLVAPAHLAKMHGVDLMEQAMAVESADHVWRSAVNLEAVMLRALLDPEISVPRFRLMRVGSPVDGGGGALPADLPWKQSSTEFPFPRLRDRRREVRRYVRRRRRFLDARGRPGWTATRGSMRRFAIAWENVLEADRLADVVAALETLINGNDQQGEVGYRVRVRTATLLARSDKERVKILDAVKAAYDYRSRVVHGTYVFDSPLDLNEARESGVKGKAGNVFHDVNEVRRLTAVVTGYYRSALERMIDRDEYQIDWAAIGV